MLFLLKVTEQTVLDMEIIWQKQWLWIVIAAIIFIVFVAITTEMLFTWIDKKIMENETSEKPIKTIAKPIGQITEQEFFETINRSSYSKITQNTAITRHGKTVNYWVRHCDNSWTNTDCRTLEN
jgi:uncharacterized protein YneF (UPF0154 family)